MENNHKITQMLELADYAFGTTIRNLKWIMWGGISWETGIDIYTLLYIKQITNNNLLYSTGNSTQYSVMAFMGKESRKKKNRVAICICTTDSLCCTPEINTTL